MPFTRRGKLHDRINNVKLWSIALGIGYGNLQQKLIKERKKTGLSKMAILGWIIMELYNRPNVFSEVK